MHLPVFTCCCTYMLLNHLKGFVWMCSALWLAAIKPATVWDCVHIYVLAHWVCRQVAAEKVSQLPTINQRSVRQTELSIFMFLWCIQAFVWVDKTICLKLFNGRAGSCAATQEQQRWNIKYAELNYAVGKMSCALDGTMIYFRCNRRIYNDERI